MFYKSISKGSILNLFRLNEPEVKLSLIFTFIIIIFMRNLGVLSNLNILQESVPHILLAVIGGLLGMLGFVLTGIAIVISLFDKLQLILVKQKKANLAKEILGNFAFEALLITFTIIFVALAYFSISIIGLGYNSCIVYLSSFFLIYLILFDLFYIIGLIDNCIRLYSVSLDTLEIVNHEKSIYDEMNEIRIDYFLNKILSSKNMTRDDFLIELIEFVNQSDLKNKAKIIEYFTGFYS